MASPNGIVSMTKNFSRKHDYKPHSAAMRLKDTHQTVRITMLKPLFAVSAVLPGSSDYTSSSDPGIILNKGRKRLRVKRWCGETVGGQCRVPLC